MSEEKRILQQNSFGKEILLTKDAYQERWLDHFASFFRLADTPLELEQLHRMRGEIIILVNKNFDRIYENQSHRRG